MQTGTNAKHELATAMISLVRLILVILICVLLVKLRSQARRRRANVSRQLSDEQQSSGSLKSRRKNATLLGPDPAITNLPLPPGPTGLPFLGYLPFVGNEIHLKLTALSEQYGPIYQIFLGGIRVVVLNDASLVRQAFRQPVFSGRPDTQLTRILQGYGIVNSDGALWKEQRAFLHTALRKLGAKSLMSGSNGLESKIQNQVKEFVNDLSVYANEKKPCQVRPIVARAVSSVVGSIVMNLTYRKYEEKEKFDRLIELMQEGFRLFTIAMPLDFIPLFRFLPGVSYAYKKMMKNREETSAFFRGVADEHRRYLRETFNLGPSSTSSLHPSGQSTERAAANSGSSAAAPAPAASAAAAAAATGNTTCDITTTACDTSSTTTEPDTDKAGSAVSGSSQTSSVDGRSSSSCAGSGGRSSGRSSRLSATGVQATSTAAATSAFAPKCSAPQTLDLNIASESTRKELHQPQSQPQNQHQHHQQQQPQQINTANGKRPVELDNIVARDLVDAYIVQQKKHEKDGKENYFSNEQLVQIMSDIFSAGLETVTSTIEWSILFLILNTDCQEQIQIEIDKVIGRQRLPQLEDLSSMPYTEATIYEVLRRSTVVALGNAHATLDDASIGGYKIPKGTQVLPNLYGIHMNPKLWNEPLRFDPSRFMINGERAHKPEYFIPFSVGRRMCLGDVLTKMEVFLFLVGLLQHYDLSVPEEDRATPPQVKGTIGVSNSPASYRVALHRRCVGVGIGAGAGVCANVDRIADYDHVDAKRQATANAISGAASESCNTVTMLHMASQAPSC